MGTVGPELCGPTGERDPRPGASRLGGSDGIIPTPNAPRDNPVYHLGEGGLPSADRRRLADPHRIRPAAVDRWALAVIPEEEIGLAKQKSARARGVYGLDALDFMRTLAIATPAKLRHAEHKAVIGWERFMRETEHAPQTGLRLALSFSLVC